MRGSPSCAAGSPAGAAARLPALEDGVPLLPNLAAGRQLGADERRAAKPSAAILDSQSAKTTEKGGQRVGRSQAPERAQTSAAGGHGRIGADRGGSRRQCHRPRRRAPGLDRGAGEASRARAGVGRRGVHRIADSVGQAGPGPHAHRRQTPEPLGPGFRRSGATTHAGRIADPAATLGGGAELGWAAIGG